MQARYSHEDDRPRTVRALIEAYLRRDYFYQSCISPSNKMSVLLTWGGIFGVVALIADFATVVIVPDVAPWLLPALVSLTVGSLFLCLFTTFILHPVVWLISAVWRHQQQKETGPRF